MRTPALYFEEEEEEQGARKAGLKTEQQDQKHNNRNHQSSCPLPQKPNAKKKVISYLNLTPQPPTLPHKPIPRQLIILIQTQPIHPRVQPIRLRSRKLSMFTSLQPRPLQRSCINTQWQRRISHFTKLLVFQWLIEFGDVLADD